MKLEEFVKESLLQIISGVKEANESIEAKDASVNPVSMGKAQVHERTYLSIPVQNIEFDVAVSVSEGAKAGGGLTVMGMGVKGGVSETSSTVSRIRFQVPIALPRGKS